MVAYCGWDPTVLVTDGVVELDGSGTSLLTLPCLNVTDVASVTVTDYWGTAYTALATAPADYSWSSDGCIEWSSYKYCGVWPAGHRNVSVVYSGGYDGPPDDLEAALQKLSGRLGGMGLGSRRMGTAAVNYGSTIAAGGLLLVEQMVFDRYRIPRAA